MNPLDATVIRLGIYIGQLEAQVGELHSQLLAKTKECEELNSQLTEKGWGLVDMPQEFATKD